MTPFIHQSFPKFVPSGWLGRTACGYVLLATTFSVMAQMHRPENKAAGNAAPQQEQGSLTELRTAEEHYQQGRTAQALDGFTRLVERYPRNAYFWFRLGNCLAKTGDLRSAMGAYDNAIVIDPSDARFHFNLAQMHLGLARGALQAATAQTQNSQAIRPEVERLLEGLSQLQDAPADNAVPDATKVPSETRKSD